MDRSSESLLLREGVMHGWGHAQNKGVIYPNLGNVPESQTDSSGFPTRKGGEIGLGANAIGSGCRRDSRRCSRAASIGPVTLPGANARVFVSIHGDLDGVPGRACPFRKLPGEKIGVRS